MEATRLRLLPWSGPNGKPAYTPDDNPSGEVARRADKIESVQTATAEAVLSLSLGMLDAGVPVEPDECVYVMRRLTECLTDVLRISESRRGRLPSPKPLELEAKDESPEVTP